MLQHVKKNVHRDGVFLGSARELIFGPPSSDLDQSLTWAGRVVYWSGAGVRVWWYFQLCTNFLITAALLGSSSVKKTGWMSPIQGLAFTCEMCIVMRCGWMRHSRTVIFRSVVLANRGGLRGACRSVPGAKRSQAIWS